jgi:hypothetical protein
MLIVSEVRTSPKKYVFVVARQHPGETQGSFVMEGFLRELLSDSPAARALLRSYIFFVVPMANPDGVYCGNSRTNVMGRDLNRHWNASSSGVTEVFMMKHVLARVRGQLEMVLDLHGHSTKTGAFFYGNSSVSNLEKAYPLLCSQLDPRIDFGSCQFGYSAAKRGSARIALSEWLYCPYIYTFEVSYYGGTRDWFSYEEQDYKKFGTSLFMGLLEFSKKTPKQLAELVESLHREDDTVITSKHIDPDSSAEEYSGIHHNID